MQIPQPVACHLRPWHGCGSPCSHLTDSYCESVGMLVLQIPLPLLQTSFTGGTTTGCPNSDLCPQHITSYSLIATQHLGFIKIGEHRSTKMLEEIWRESTLPCYVWSF